MNKSSKRLMSTRRRRNRSKNVEAAGSEDGLKWWETYTAGIRSDDRNKESSRASQLQLNIRVEQARTESLPLPEAASSSHLCCNPTEFFDPAMPASARQITLAASVRR